MSRTAYRARQHWRPPFFIGAVGSASVTNKPRRDRYRHQVRSTCPSTSALAPTTDLRQQCPEQPVMTQSRSAGHPQLGKGRFNDLPFAAMSVLTTIASGATLDAAFAWLCKRRQNYPASADVWDFRRDRPQEKACMQSELLAGRRPAKCPSADHPKMTLAGATRHFQGMPRRWRLMCRRYEN